MSTTSRYNRRHKPTIYPQDGETCRYCRAWSDAAWSKPCPATLKRRAEIDAQYAEREAEL
jgi:hypothetical protein